MTAFRPPNSAISARVPAVGQHADDEEEAAGRTPCASIW